MAGVIGVWAVSRGRGEKKELDRLELKERKVGKMAGKKKFSSKPFE